MDPGTIIAITSLVIQVVSSIKTVVDLFGRFQNAPRELRLFSLEVSRLSRELQGLESLERPGENLLHEENYFQIEDTIKQCIDLFDQAGLPRHDSIQTASTGKVLRETWSNQPKLKDLREEINRHYVQIIIPLTLKSLKSQCHVTPQTGSQPEHLAKNKPTQKQPVVSQAHINDLESGLSALRIYDGVRPPEEIIRELGDVLKRCWRDIGSSDVGPGLTIPGLANSRRNSNAPYIPLSTTLMLDMLDDVPERHRTIFLKKVNIIAEDSENRILSFEDQSGSIRVTHIVPYHSIPWTKNMNARTVCFRTTHVLTVIDAGIYHVYKTDPKYHFKHRQKCLDFQETLRVREHLGAFDAKSIARGKDVLALRQVIRLWKRETSEAGLEVTMVFFASSRDEHRELNLYDFVPEAHFDGGIKRRWSREVCQEKESEKVIIHLRGYSGEYRIEFMSITDAKNFKNCFNSEHPSNQPPPQIDWNIASSSTSAISNTPIPTPSGAIGSQGRVPPQADPLVLDDERANSPSWDSVFNQPWAGSWPPGSGADEGGYDVEDK